jgi:hypothetical protein
MASYKVQMYISLGITKRKLTKRGNGILLKNINSETGASPMIPRARLRQFNADRVDSIKIIM